ncbi:MAG: radical SAM protein [Candidatus Bathyarchaeota archaeon]|nr:radical SAM protein [Candidatus Bathyarchaeum tardum]WGM90510.1 MAG: radical SAM protein [Candidatus Bathyarchaeum tardum]
MKKMKTSQLAPKVISGFLKFKAGRPTPLFASYNVTGRCNMKCKFCEWWKHEIPELSTKKALAAIDAVCNLGVPFFDLSGGEPLLRKDLIVLAKRVASHGCLVSMNTNGTLLTENIIVEVAGVFDTVVVSLDGPKRMHDEIRGVPGTYEKAIEAIKLLKAHGVKTGVNSVATPWNIDVLPEFIEELRSIVDIAQVQPMHPYPPTPENIPSKQQVSFLMDYLLALKRSDPSFLALPTEFIKGFEQFFQGTAPKICHAGELYVAINPEGKLLACPARSDLILGDATTDSIDTILKQRNTKGWRQVSKCKGCWLECTAGVSMMLKNPFKEASQLVGLWASR